MPIDTNALSALASKVLTKSVDNATADLHKREGRVNDSGALPPAGLAYHALFPDRTKPVRTEDVFHAAFMFALELGAMLAYDPLEEHDVGDLLKRYSS